MERKIGKEKKRAKTKRNSNIFVVVRKYLIREEIWKKRDVDEEIYPLLPSLSPWKSNVPKLYAYIVYTECEYSVKSVSSVYSCNEMYLITCKKNISNDQILEKRKFYKKKFPIHLTKIKMDVMLSPNRGKFWLSITILCLIVILSAKFPILLVEKRFLIIKIFLKGKLVQNLFQYMWLKSKSVKCWAQI